MRNKFEIPGKCGIMQGYSRERIAYRIYDLENKKVIKERTVKFNESLKGSSYLGKKENFQTRDIDSFDIISPKENETNQQTKNKISSETTKNENDSLFPNCENQNNRPTGVSLENVDTLQQEIISGKNSSNTQLRRSE